jgi:phospho-N-acetylmuramoyl-pentapeptide-transferase
VDYLSIEFAGIPALFISFIATVVLSRIGIPIIRAKKMGQPIRDDGPESHHAKSGVPTMGGILMVIPVLLIALVFGGDRSGWLVLLGMLFLGAVGFIDDYEKLTKKQSLGLDERQKIILQVSLAAVLVVLYGLLTQQPHLQFIPFSRQAIDFSVFAYPLNLDRGKRQSCPRNEIVFSSVFRADI